MLATSIHRPWVRGTSAHAARQSAPVRVAAPVPRRLRSQRVAQPGSPPCALPGLEEFTRSSDDDREKGRSFRRTVGHCDSSSCAAVQGVRVFGIPVQLFSTASNSFLTAAKLSAAGVF